MCFFLRSTIPALSLSLLKCPTPIGFQTVTSSFWYLDQHFTVFLHSLHHAMGRIQSQPGMKGSHASEVALQCQSKAVSGANRREGGTYLPWPVI